LFHITTLAMSRSNLEARLAQCSENLITSIETFKQLTNRPNILPAEPFNTLISTKLQTTDIDIAISQCNNTKILLDEGIKILNYEKRRRQLCGQLNSITEIIDTKEQIKTACRSAKRRRIDMSDYLQRNEETTSQVSRFFMLIQFYI